MFGIGVPGTFGFGIQEIIILIGVLIIIAVASSFRRKGNIRFYGPALVLKKFKINQNPISETDEIIAIAGRRPGIITWLLTTMGLDAVDSLIVTGREFRHRTVSLVGQFNEVCPLTSISSVHCAYRRPIWNLIFAGLIIIAGLYAWLDSDGKFFYFLISLLIALIFIVAYVLLKKILIEIHTRGGLSIGLSFKRSVIENIPVDIEQAKSVINIINNLVLRSQHREVLFQNIYKESISLTGEGSDKSQEFCIHCGQPFEGGKFCTGCGKSV